MAPSSGHLLVPKVWRAVKFVINKTTSLIQSKTGSTAALRPVPITIPVRAQNHPVHPLAFLRQTRNSSSQHTRWFSTAFRRRSSPFSTFKTASYGPRASLPSSRISRSVSCAFGGGSAFATTLRPNLIGGVISRTAGFARNGATRQFSSAPVSQAQVMTNVSQAVRAFCLQGQKVQYDGTDARTGEKRFSAVSSTHERMTRRILKAREMESVKGAKVQFSLSPTITAVGGFPSSGFTVGAGSTLDKDVDRQTTASLEQTISNPALLRNLAADMARAVKDMSATLADLHRLSILGDLSISTATSSTGGPKLEVHFPGCDASTVESLCDEVGVRRGVVVEHPAWTDDREAEMALLFPFAPSGLASEKDKGSENDYDATIERGYFSYRPNKVTKRQPGRAEMEWKTMLSRSPSLPHVQRTAEIETETETPSSPFQHLSTRSMTSDESDDENAHISSDHSALAQSNPGRSQQSTAVNPWLLSAPSEAYDELSDSDLGDEDLNVVWQSPSPSPVSTLEARDYEGVEGIYRFLRECDTARQC